MTTISQTDLYRLLKRCEQIHDDAEVQPDVKSMYEDTLATPAATYRSACEAIRPAETQAQKVIDDAANAVKKISEPARLARAILLGRFPSTSVPGTVKEQKTDTDRHTVIGELLALVRHHAGEPWADSILAGPFGVQAPDVLDKLDAAAAAKTQRAATYEARAVAMAECLPPFLAFREAVRQSPGPQKKFYLQLRLRGTVVPPDVPPPPDPPAPVVTPPLTTTTPALAAPPRSS